jgi:hypothetical protein
MAEIGKGELEKRAEDIKAIRGMLAQSSDIPLIYPWAFFAWAFLVGAGAITHYELFIYRAIEVRAALVWIWLPALVVGASAEGVSFAMRASKQALPLFNRRIGGAILGCIASMVVFTVIVIRLALIALTPGIAILMAALPLAFYAQISYASLFIETFGGIAVGLLFEFAGAAGPELYLAGGCFTVALYATAGIHVWLIERRRRG